MTKGRMVTFKVLGWVSVPDDVPDDEMEEWAQDNFDDFEFADWDVEDIFLGEDDED